MQITQKEKILALYNSIQNAHCLFFIMSTKLNRWEIKTDRNLFIKNGLHLYKTNNYRGREIFNNFPFTKIMSQAVQGPFFLAHADKQKNYKELKDLFNFSAKHMKILFAVQNNTLFHKKRVMLLEKIEEKNILAWPLNTNNVYFLLSNVYTYILFIIKFPAKIQV